MSDFVFRPMEPNICDSAPRNPLMPTPSLNFDPRLGGRYRSQALSSKTQLITILHGNKINRLQIFFVAIISYVRCCLLPLIVPIYWQYTNIRHGRRDNCNTDTCRHFRLNKIASPSIYGDAKWSKDTARELSINVRYREGRAISLKLRDIPARPARLFVKRYPVNR